MDVCTCGHAEDEHGGDPAYPGNTSCTGLLHDEEIDQDVPCDCIAYEEDEDEEV